MQNTSATYKNIIAGNHWFETQITLDGHLVTEAAIKSATRTRPGMYENKPSIGGAIASVLDLVILKPAYSISRRATITVVMRAKNSSQTSEWLPAGTYYVDSKKYNNAGGNLSTVAITAYDAMMLFEQDYPDTSHNWPYPDISVVNEMANYVGVTVDSRTPQFLTSRYMVDLPVSYTMRETLEQIAAANAGNFVITAEGKLLFVPLYGLEYEDNCNYLAYDNDGTTALQFGNEGWYIIV